MKVSSMKGWTSRFVRIKDGAFTVSKSEHETEPPIENFPLITCAVKIVDSNHNKSFRFQVITPQKSLTFKVRTSEAMHSWINVLQVTC